METTMNIMVFGQLVDITGAPSVTINDVADTEMLLQELYVRFPLLQEKKFLLALNQEIITEKKEIGAQAQLALLPPFSGG
jgi:sulfur-carrier protein